MPRRPADVPDVDVLAATDELLAVWQSWVEAGTVILNPRPDFQKHELQAHMLVTLTTHLFELARLIRPHLPGSIPITLMPVVRSAVETTIWVVWVDFNQDAADAAINRGERQRRTLARAIRESSLVSPDHSGLDIGEWTDRDTTQGNEAKNLEAMAKSVGMADVYVFFRMYSSVVHPGTDLIDAYLRHVDEDRTEYLPRAEPDYRSGVTNRILPLLLLRAARIVNYMSRDKQRRSELQRVARMLNVDLDKLWNPHHLARSTRPPRR